MPEFSIPEIENREHIAPDKTGDNIAAKRTANYNWDGSNWQRVATSFFANNYDDMIFTNSDANGNYQILTLKKNGSTVNVYSISYDANSNITEFKKTS